MTFDEARAALEAAGVAFKERSGCLLAFTIDGVPYEALYREGVVCTISDHRELASFDEVRALLQQQIALCGAPLAMGHGMTENHEWAWNGVWASVGRSRDDRWSIDFTQTAKPPYDPGPSARSVEELRTLARETRARIATTSPGHGARAVAVAAWREAFEDRICSLEAAAAVIESIAPATPIVSPPGHQLVEHADWLARHEVVFDHPDDHRGAIVVGPNYSLFNAPGYFGWHFDRASQKPLKQYVLLAEGPFAYGVYRRMAIADELYPDPGDPSGVEPPRPSIEEEIAQFRAAMDAGKPPPTDRRDRVLARLALARARAGNAE